jgi:hypothetical protein
LSKEALYILQRIEHLKELFTTFERDEQEKMPQVPVFKQGAGFYQNLLNFNFGQIFNELEKDIVSAREQEKG